jgi:hypothetical protein
LLFLSFAYTRLFAVKGVWMLEKRVLSMWKGRVMMMVTVSLMYHRQGYLQAGVIGWSWRFWRRLIPL